MRQAYRTGGFEDVGGYARAVRSGNVIAVSGTAATGADGQALHPGDVSQQTRHALEVALEAVEQLGGRREDVLRTRLFLAPASDWRAAVDVHREFFAEVTPANTTLFVAGFPPPGVLVEVELDAVVE
jgi:enamine deaminase RidA (YjgF/YER057c/UK114 family)